MIDDPHDTEKVVSEKERRRALHNFDHKLYTRLNDRKEGVIVVVMQRLHTRDLSGHLLEGSDGSRWEHRPDGRRPSDRRLQFRIAF